MAPLPFLQAAHALDEETSGLSPGVKAPMLWRSLKGHVRAEARMGRFER
jgi:phosphatidylethanolamine-binding protein (PEBP) family uncharacterized protein